MDKKVPYKNMIKENITIHEFEPIVMDNGYEIKVRLKAFVLLDPLGKEYERGPCTSLQLFHNGHFIKALALPPGIEAELIDRLEKANRFLVTRVA